MKPDTLTQKIAALNQRLNARAKALIECDPEAQRIIGEANAYQALLDELAQKKRKPLPKEKKDNGTTAPAAPEQAG